MHHEAIIASAWIVHANSSNQAAEGSIGIEPVKETLIDIVNCI
jgi:hypothetical protein